MARRRTVTDAEVIDAILTYRKSFGYSPSMRDLGNMLGLRSTKSVFMMLREMRDRGIITYTDRRPRSVMVVKR